MMKKKDPARVYREATIELFAPKEVNNYGQEDEEGEKESLKEDRQEKKDC